MTKGTGCFTRLTVLALDLGLIAMVGFVLFAVISGGNIFLFLAGLVFVASAKAFVGGAPVQIDDLSAEEDTNWKAYR